MLEPSLLPESRRLASLKQVILERKAIIVVGAGVSLSTTDNLEVASWKGLLKSGLERCVTWGAPPPLSQDWGELMGHLLNKGDLLDWLLIAEQISRRLGAPYGGEYEAWLHESLGMLPLKNTRLIEAIIKLKCPILTTNYDNLIERCSGMPAITWKNRHDIQKWLYGGRGVFHIHGFYDAPETVVLSITDYNNYVRSQFKDAFQKMLPIFSSFVFIGCGKGIEDPNISSMLNWISTELSEYRHRHYVLVKNNEKINIALPPGYATRIFEVDFGSKVDDLPRFVEELCYDEAEANPTIISPTNEILREEDILSLQRFR